MLYGADRARRAGASLLMASIIIMLAVITCSALAAEPPAWQPYNPNPTNPIQPGENESSTRHEKREYTKEDGTIVTEERLVCTEYSDGEYKYTKTYTWSTETKGDETTKTDSIETVDAKGNRTFSRRWNVTKPVPGGIRTDYFVEEKGKIYYTGYSMKYDKVSGQDGKSTEKEKEAAKKDSEGNPTEKISYKLTADGNVQTDRYVWSALKRDWMRYGAAEVGKPIPPLVTSPSMATFGYAFGGTLGNDPIAIIAVSKIVATSASGRKVDIAINDEGHWAVGPGVLSTGLWELSAVMNDGRTGAASTLIITPALSLAGQPSLGGVPRMLFVDSYLSLPGNYLTSKSFARPPDVLFSTDTDSIRIEAIAFSDKELLLRVPDSAPIGGARITVNNGDSISIGKETCIASFDIIVPETIHVGYDFLVTIRLSGLRPEMLKESFSAIITISGSARFKGTDSRDVLVELVNGTAYLIAQADSTGQFFISGKLVNLPEY